MSHFYHFRVFYTISESITTKRPATYLLLFFYLAGLSHLLDYKESTRFLLALLKRSLNKPLVFSFELINLLLELVDRGH